MGEDQQRQALRQRLDQRYQKSRVSQNTEANSYVFDMATKLEKHRHLFDESTFDPKDVQRYGSHELGRHMLLARRMLEAGVRFVKVNSYGWDTHGDNFNGQLSLVGKFDQAFAAIIEDLAQRGMLENVLVVAMSEFGRTPRINGHIGRDHWPEAWSIAMAGTGLKPGVMHGETNSLGTWVKTAEYDMGHLMHTWFYALGINSHEVAYDNAGQPLPLAREDMTAIEEVLA